MAPGRAMYLCATTIAVADGEASLLKPLDAASIDRVGALESGCLSYAPAMPFKASNWSTYQKRLWWIFQSAWDA
jgi:murein endopeptidase